MSRGLSLSEIALLLEVESVREAALARARTGDILGCQQLLDQAQRVCSEADLSPPARLCGVTFQEAAASYLYYRGGNFNEAIARMLNSLEASRQLCDVHGYDMEFRKVHLGRNIIRVEAVSGEVSPAATHIALLVRYIVNSDPGAWPISDSHPWSTMRPLNTEEVAWCCDELVRDIFLASQSSPIFVTLLLQNLPRFAQGFLGRGAGAPLERALSGSP
jgi:hypothetical protein